MIGSKFFPVSERLGQYWTLTRLPTHVNLDVDALVVPVLDVEVVAHGLDASGTFLLLLLGLLLLLLLLLLLPVLLLPHLDLLLLRRLSGLLLAAALLLVQQRHVALVQVALGAALRVGHAQLNSGGERETW